MRPARHPTPCHFFARGNCLRGETCWFAHESHSTFNGAPAPDTSTGESSRRSVDHSLDDTGYTQSIQAVLEHPLWHAEVTSVSQSTADTVLEVAFPPSDPDFPFDLSYVRLEFTIPAARPFTPTQFRILNDDIPMGVARNLECALEKHCQQHEAGGIRPVALIEWLDSQLEILLQQTPASTVRFVSFGSTKHSNEEKKAEPVKPPCTVPPATTSSLPSSTPSVDNEKVGPADPCRELELRQLERRFRTSFEWITPVTASQTQLQFVLNVTDPDFPLKNRELSIHLTVPHGYPQEPAVLDIRPNLQQRDRFSPARIRTIQQAFTEHKRTFPKKSLLHQLNWLDRNLCELLKRDIPAMGQKAPQSKPSLSTSTSQQTTLPPGPVDPNMTANVTNEFSDLTLQHRPTGTYPNAKYDRDSSSDEPPSHSTGPPPPDVASSTQTQWTPPTSKGIQMRFSTLTLTGSDLGFVTQLSLMVSCQRCRTSCAVSAIPPTFERTFTPTAEGQFMAPSTHPEVNHSSEIVGSSSSTADIGGVLDAQDHQKWVECSGCHQSLGVRFRPDLFHAHSTSLGYLDCANCVPLDVLPSSYHLVCDRCSVEVRPPQDTPILNVDPIPAATTTAPLHSAASAGSHRAGKTHPLGALAVSMPTNLHCIACYNRLHISLGPVQFVRISPGWALTSPDVGLLAIGKGKNKKGHSKEKLGIVPGQPLPDKGSCKHFKKSFRWFRFPCCGKVYPCGDCHDEKEDHINEMAKRIICGFCSREQPFRSQAVECAHCGAKYVKHLEGRAFWEGGQGVRDKSKMSRKDTKKYQGMSKSLSKKAIKKA
ncbi:hypothetical protein IWQ62_003737 [Dispira parvispora]|uniref:CHY-type domain-containing protein n=1 Tax=Dispira parvispora TaxID=1520584 RepID=A0A9W8AMY2_9FUNG|nr:hypothetical protein IWQ62_003737 [Dispira parvispora]